MRQIRAETRLIFLELHVREGERVLVVCGLFPASVEADEYRVEERRREDADGVADSIVERGD